MALQSIRELGFGGSGIPTSLPRAIAELQGLTISGPLTGVASGTAIAIAEGIEEWDTVIKALMFAGGVPSDITGNVTVVDRRAKLTLTLGAVAVGDQVTIAGKTYTLGTLSYTQTLDPGLVPVSQIGVNDTAATLAKIIMSSDSRLYAAASANVVTVYWRVLGAVGNTVTASVANSNGHVTASGTTFAGGSDTPSIILNVNSTGNTVVLFWYKKMSTPVIANYNLLNH
jgi:hypothetical protein